MNNKNKNSIFYMKKQVYEQIVQYCKEEAPIEACGLVSGVDNKGFSFWPVPNEDKSPVRFTISDDSMMKTIKKIEIKREQLTGVFHSHPITRAYPSFYDVKNYSYPSIAYIIVSLLKSEPAVNCFRITENKKVIKLKLELI
ncbi:hypothetical protein BTR23_16110 [Alkalihalophilus pseudofirmus]|nr:hypothetical protein BTR23_16110 [Alkalihalophilus pseudofirmus]